MISNSDSYGILKRPRVQDCGGAAAKMIDPWMILGTVRMLYEAVHTYYINTSRPVASKKHQSPAKK
jgi:hypothetical protein